MTVRYLIPLLFWFALLPGAAAQSDDGDAPLGDLARAMRASDKPSQQPVIDNDNLSQTLKELKPATDNTPVFSIRGNKFDMSSPDGSCSLSFNANATALITDPVVNRELPPSELAKLDGPAVINNNTLEVSIYNGTAWNLTDVTIGLTVIRHNASGEPEAAFAGSAKLVPATLRDVDDEPSENSANSEGMARRSDTTVLYHLKGLAEPLKTTTFREMMASALEPGTEWHWAIVQAKGAPPKPIPALSIPSQAIHLPMSALPALPLPEVKPPLLQSRATRMLR